MSEQQFTRGKGCNNRKLSDADRANLVTLCGRCHGLAHADERKGVVAECQS